MSKIQLTDRARDESRRLIKRWYEELASDEQRDRKVVYLFTSGAIPELFRSFDFRIVLPELHAIHCAMSRIAVDMIHHGESLGYAADVCGYVKCDIGLMTGPPAGKVPFGGLGGVGRIPPPDLLVVNHAGCSTHIKWFEALGRRFDPAPPTMHIIDVPFIREESPTAFDRAYVRGQLEELIGVCEEITGRKFDIDRLRDILELSKEAIELWRRLLEYGKKQPSPIDGVFQAAFYMAPMSVWRGTQECVDYYREALSEIRERAAALERGTSPNGGVGEERFRLLIDGSLPWPRFREFWEMFKKWNAVAVAGSYPRVVCAYEELGSDPSRPFEFLADLATQSYLNWNLGKRRRFLERMASEYKVDGIVIHSLKSCRPYSIGQLDLRNYFAREAGIPTLFLDSDVADPRYFSSALIMNRIDTFLEALGQRKDTHKLEDSRVGGTRKDSGGEEKGEA